MKQIFSALVLILLVSGMVSCKKTGFITSGDARLSFSADTLHFDTVFTTTGSITKTLKIFNQNDQKLRISTIQLMGGSLSAFKINVDGTAGVSFSNIEIEPNDSIYVFATVTINPNAANLPFIVQDSILVSYNGNRRFVQLDAFGQNANFLRNRRVTKDSTWTNNLPFVILGSLTVDQNFTLTIPKGTKVFCHADAPILVNGTMKVNGEKNERVVFAGDRLDDPYKDFPGSWPGIFFNASSKDNVLNYAIIKNAYQGVIAQLPASNSNPKVTLNQCILDNIFDAGILGLATSINATNCLISNCGSNVQLAAGGNYVFNHCTVSTIGNFFINHKNPVLFVTNSAGQNQSNNLSAIFRNSIFYGEGGNVEDEVLVEKTGTTTYSVNFENCLYKVKTDQTAAGFTNSLKNQPPMFDSINAGRRIFDFHLKLTSPAINKGVVSGVNIDLDGKARGGAAGLPDMGCYEQ